MTRKPVKKKKILLIEDDKLTVDLYRESLGLAGFDVEVFSFGKDAIEKIEKIEQGKEDAPDFALLDLLLPDINGIEVLEKMRKTETLKDTPVFVLTNYTNRELENRGYDLNVSRFLLKTDYIPSQLIGFVKKEFEKIKKEKK